MTDIPQLTPTEFWAAMLGIGIMALAALVSGIWLYVRLRGMEKTAHVRAEEIQQRAQTLINDNWQRAQERNDAIQEKYESLLAKHTALTIEKNNLEMRVGLVEARLETQRGTYEDKIAGLAGELKTTRGALDVASDALKSANRRLHDSEVARGEMAATVDDLKQRITAQDARIADLEKRLVEQGQQMDKITRMLADESDARRLAEQRAASLTRRVEELERLIQEKDRKIERLEAELAAKVWGEGKVVADGTPAEPRSVAISHSDGKKEPE